MDTLLKPSSKTVCPFILCDLLDCLRHKDSEKFFFLCGQREFLGHGHPDCELRKFRSLEKAGFNSQPVATGVPDG